MSYLPEAHTDFMLAVLGEEFGFLGIFVVLSLSFAMLIACIKIGHRALKTSTYVQDIWLMASALSSYYRLW